MKTTLKSKVLSVLREEPETRNSDIKLTIKLWEKFYRKYLIKGSLSGRLGVVLENLFKLPTQDNIRRIRAKVQNEEKMYLPTSIKVIKQRKINEKEWREYINKCKQ